jgi:hypothetical protein
MRRVLAIAVFSSVAMSGYAQAPSTELSLSASQSFPTSEAAAAQTQKRVIGTWRGNWSELLVPKFKSDAESSPIWLQFMIENGQVIGTVSHDAIDLTEQKGSDVKLMHVLPKNRVSPMFDIDISGDVVSFKERDRDDGIVEHRLEILQDGMAVLHTKHQRTTGENQSFRPWLTVTKQ